MLRGITGPRCEVFTATCHQSSSLFLPLLCQHFNPAPFSFLPLQYSIYQQIQVYSKSQNVLTKKKEKGKIPVSNLISSQYLDSFILLKELPLGLYSCMFLYHDYNILPVYFAGKINLFAFSGSLGSFIFYFKVLI